MTVTANDLKEKGNKLFTSGDYSGAEEQYTLAIQKSSSNPILFTNRAFARIKLQRWEDVIDDCLHSIELTGHGPNYKAFYYLAQAQLALNHPHEALTSAMTAYNQVMNPSSARERAAASSITPILAVVMKCKRAKFEARQHEQGRRRGDLLSELSSALETSKRHALSEIEAHLSTGALQPIAAAEARAETIDATQKKLDDLASVFAVADPANCAKKEIPDWAVDTITFELIHDPVMTRNGHSYERSTLLEHLKRSATDPLTREPLTVDELRPNIALRKALDEFWERAEGWAMDW